MPVVILRDLMMEDAADRYAWCLDQEVTKHLNMPDQYPPFTLEETQNWIDMCIKRTNGYVQKAILTESSHHRTNFTIIDNCNRRKNIYNESIINSLRS